MNNMDELLSKWNGLLHSPDWYLTVLVDIAAIKPLNPNKAKKELYDFFEQHIRQNDIAFDDDPPLDADAERAPIDTAVIHHTSNPPGMSLERLSAIELIRLYAPEFAKPKYEKDNALQGRAIYSGHFRGGRQVFWPYHWFVRRDGTVERLLNDDEIGWHAGDWNVNCRSVAICFDGDFENARPSDAELVAAADIIKGHYPRIARECIVGHREVNPKTTCPSNLFLASAGGRGWKEDLLDFCYH